MIKDKIFYEKHAPQARLLIEKCAAGNKKNVQ